MKRSKYLSKRNSTYYFRFPNPLSYVKLSLETSDYYEAQHLRDKLLNVFQGFLMSDDIKDKLEKLKGIKERAKEIVSREKAKNGGKLIVPDREIKHYLPNNTVIADQEYLERTIKLRLMYLEKERIRNGGRFSELLIEELKLWADTKVLYYPFTEEDNNLFEKISFLPDLNGAKYHPKDPVELHITLKEAYLNISVEYLTKHNSLPLTNSTKDAYNHLIELGVLKPENNPQSPIECNTNNSTEKSNIKPACKNSLHKSLYDVFNEYVEEKKASESTSQNTVEDIIKILELALEFIGKDKDIKEANNRISFINYKKALKSMPTNRNKGKYKGKTIHELSTMKIEGPLMSITTTNKYLRYMASLFKYAEEREYITKSQAYKLQDPKKVRAREQNDRFSADELVMLFSELKQNYGTSKKQEKFWIPLISLFTSCRLNEVCQLTSDNIVKFDGIWFFKITTDSDETNSKKSLKTLYSERNIPVHKTLLELGLIEYIQPNKVNSSDNVWGLKYEDSRNKYGRTVGRTFNDIRKKLFNPPARRKTFHSLRHTFATFARKTIDNELVMYFDGHSSDNQTFGRYAKYDDYKWMKTEMDKLKYPTEVEKLFKSWINNS